MSQQVFVLMHSHEMAQGGEDIKLIGVYSSQAAANAAVVRAKSLPGFSQMPTVSTCKPIRWTKITGPRVS
jgi:hypothetical protein